MDEAGTLLDAFIDELRDTYDAEKQLTKALAKLAKASSNPSLDERVRGKHCDGIAGIIEAGKSITRIQNPHAR